MTPDDVADLIAEIDNQQQQLAVLQHARDARIFAANQLLISEDVFTELEEANRQFEARCKAAEEKAEKERLEQERIEQERRREVLRKRQLLLARAQKQRAKAAAAQDKTVSQLVAVNLAKSQTDALRSI